MSSEKSFFPATKAIRVMEFDDLGLLLSAARCRMDLLEGQQREFETYTLSPRGELSIETEELRVNYVLSTDGVRSYDEARNVSRRVRLWGGIGQWYDSGLGRVAAPPIRGGRGYTTHDGALHLYHFDSLPDGYLPDEPTPHNLGSMSDLVALGLSGEDIDHLREVGPIGRALANGMPNVIEMFLYIGGDRFLWSHALRVS